MFVINIRLHDVGYNLSYVNQKKAEEHKQALAYSKEPNEFLELTDDFSQTLIVRPKDIAALWFCDKTGEAQCGAMHKVGEILANITAQNRVDADPMIQAEVKRQQHKQAVAQQAAMSPGRSVGSA